VGCAEVVRPPAYRSCAILDTGILADLARQGEMVSGVPGSIALITQFITLEPGDLLCMGTPGGGGATTQTYLQSGDLVGRRSNGWGDWSIRWSN
jgi:2-keto-4-pentenoate hydratase/2-oxohepta-3-ene-1,7-dioic acid hydratase in catechol pathway